MEAYLLAIIPVLLTAFLATFGWVLTRMVRLSEVVATCVEKVDAINVEHRHLEDRVDALILSRIQG